MKLFIFAIGGTGSRVLKSLTMLLASGVDFKADKIVPIIIDADVSSADLTRTTEIVKNYNHIRKYLSYTESIKNKFFKPIIDTPVLMELANTRQLTFKEFIGLSSMDKANKALASMLFSQKNLDSSMEVGFKGNPNVGSVVLNQFKDSKAFSDFTSQFKNGDRIFIISSIFGGTGASGFPLLAKTLRTLDGNTFQNAGSIINAPIGAISVLPYFTVNQDESSEIDSSTFISKTKAALNYYRLNLKEVNQLYFIADRKTTEYSNHEGGTSQKNNAHFIEMMSALAIKDFLSIPNDAMPEQNTSADVPISVKEYGIPKDTNDLTFDSLDEDTKNTVLPKMARYRLFALYLDKRMDSRKDRTWATDHSIDDAFVTGDFYKKLKTFNASMDEWLKEMSMQERKFMPFESGESNEDLFHFVRGRKSYKVFSLNSNYDLFDEYLNKESGHISMQMDKEMQFIELFYRAVDKLIIDKLKM